MKAVAASVQKVSQITLTVEMKSVDELVSLWHSLNTAPFDAARAAGTHYGNPVATAEQLQPSADLWNRIDSILRIEMGINPRTYFLSAQSS